MFCGKCGKEIADDQKFCMYCGAETGIAPRTPQQEIPNSEATEENSKKSRKKKGDKKKHKAVRIVIPVLVFLVVAAAAVGVAVHFLNPEEEYYRAKIVSYGLVDYNDPGKGLKVTSTVEYREDGQITHEETEYAVTDYSYDGKNRITSVEARDKDAGETYSFSVTYEEKDGIYIGKTNVVSEGDGNSVYREYHYNSEDRLIYTATYNNDELFEYEKTEYNLNGDVKMVESDGKHPFKSIAEYDDDGNITSVTYYDDNGELYDKYEYEYKDNKLYKFTNYGISEVVLNKEEGNKTEYICYDGDNNIEGYMVLIHDDNDHVIMQEYFDENHNRTNNYATNKYDENGNCILSENYQDGSIYSKTESTYALKKK